MASTAIDGNSSNTKAKCVQGMLSEAGIGA